MKYRKQFSQLVEKLVIALERQPVQVVIPALAAVLASVLAEDAPTEDGEIERYVTVAAELLQKQTLAILAGKRGAIQLAEELCEDAAHIANVYVAGAKKKC